MINIKVGNNKVILQGHAGYAEKGQDIICAAVSILVSTFTNMYDVLVIEDDEEVMEIVWDNDADPKFMIFGFELLEYNYKDYVKVEKIKEKND